MQKTVSSPCPFSRLATAGAVVLSLGLAVGCGPESTSSPDARRLTDAPVGGTDANVPTDASVTDASVTDAGLADATVVVPDATIVPPDAMVMVDAAAPVLGHLLLSEVVVPPTEGEYVEIFNPTSAAIVLTNYYLSDDQEYGMLPGATGATDAPNLSPTGSDFIVQFPAGSFIAAGQAITVAINGTNFIATYAVDPSYSIGSNDGSALPMILSAGNNAATITNGGESIILFYWDGVSDLVQDVDCLNVGLPTAGNALTSKTGLMVDGPDADTTPSTYLEDALTIPQQIDSPRDYNSKDMIVESTKRIMMEGIEVDMGGNGILGHDETTENTLVTWDEEPYSPATPNVSDIVMP